MPGLPSIPGLTESEPNAFDEACDCFPSLSYKQRVIGFIACLVIGWVVSLLGTIVFWSGDIKLFAVLYVIGSCISIASTSFLIGPANQCKKVSACGWTFEWPTRLELVISYYIVTRVIILLPPLIS